MDPVFMILGQSCAIAAALCLREQTSIQNLSYRNLKSELERAGQVLSLDGTDTPPFPHGEVEAPVEDESILVG